MGNNRGDDTSMNFLRDVISQAIDYKLYNIHTCTVGRIESYDYNYKKASVQPLIKKTFTDGTTQLLPRINNVPVVMPFSNNSGLSFPVNVGDSCLLVFCERSLDQWLSFGDEVENPDPRAFDISDAIAIMGLNAFNETSTITNNDDIILKFNDSLITIQKNGDIILNANGIIIKLTSSGTVAIGKGSNELLQQIYNVFDKLGQEALAAGMAQTAIAAQAATLSIGQIKGSL